MILILITFIPAFFISCLNTARYWPFLFLYPAWLLVSIMEIEQKKIRIFCFYFIFICSSFSIFPIIGNWGYRFIKTANTKNVIKQKLNKDEKGLYFETPGVIYNLYDYNVHCIQKNLRTSNKSKLELVFRYATMDVYK